MREIAPLPFMIPRTGRFILAAVLLVSALRFAAQAAVPFSLNISGDYGTFYGDYPYFVIHNESRYNITQFEMTIGNLNKNFDAVWYQYVPHGTSSINSC